MTKNSARYIITTADERTWKFDRPVIFMGEWCRRYDRRHIWADMDAIVAAPYGLGRAKKDSDHSEARELEKKLFSVLCEVLNQYHGVQHSERFWRIVLGHWLYRYVDVMLNRVKTLEQCFKAYQISGTTSYANDHYTLATPDSFSAILACNDDCWNNVLIARIMELHGLANFPIEVIDCASTSFSYNVQPHALTLKRKVLRWGYKKVTKLENLLVKDKDAFIINSYLPKKEEIKLQLAVGQYPRLWVTPKIAMPEKSDKVLRKSLTKQVANKSGDRIEMILSTMLFELMPACYLEGFANLNDLMKQQPWPKDPKFIFTSNNFDTDEVFKLWAATKIESGTKYFTGQHGNNYGALRNNLDPSNEEVTADKFLTWGWTDGLPQHTPAFIFTIAGRKAQSYNSQGGLLLIELSQSHRIHTFDCIAESIKYIKDQESFVRELSIEPKLHLTIRLKADSKYFKQNDEIRWAACDPSLKIDAGNVVIRDLIAKSRLVVHSYDSTGILETLSQNIPTLAFWQNGFDHLRESAKPYYQLLVDAGIVHLTPESVAQKVNEVWDEVDCWWAQNKVQDARRQFCDRYARVSRSPIANLKKILLSI